MYPILTAYGIMLYKYERLEIHKGNLGSSHFNRIYNSWAGRLIPLGYTSDAEPYNIRATQRVQFQQHKQYPPIGCYVQ